MSRTLAQLGYRTTRGRETVEFWKSQLYASKNQWKRGEGIREPIRTMISELNFPLLMIKDGGNNTPSSHGTDAALKKRFPHIDQIDLNLPLRYVQKLTANIGDEVPEVRWLRDWTAPWEQHAYKFDRLTQRFMSHAGAPENNSEGAKDICSEGVTTFWINFTYDLSADDLFRATESVDQVIERILEDPEAYEPAEGADHELMAEVLESRAYDFQTDVRDPTGMVANALALAATKHYLAASKDYTNTWRWRSNRLHMEHERLPYGTHALMESTTTDFRHARWVARLLRMPVHDARQHPAFHPSIRKDIERDEIIDSALNATVETGWQKTTDQVNDEYLGLCSVWEIHDRKYKEIIYLDLNMDRFLNAGTKNGVSRMQHPFLDQKGLPIIPAMGPHPGFFPCDVFAPQKPQRNNEFKKLGTPLLQPGMKLIYAITKLVSHYVQTVKRASSAIYEAHPKLNDAARRAIKAGIDGTIFTRPADVPPGESVLPVQWKAPSEQLFRQVNEMIGQWCMVQSFPMAELTTQPQAETATQEEIGISAGDVWMGEVIRKFELSYAVQCNIAMHLAMHFTTKPDWAELIGGTDANLLHALVTQIRFPPDLPAVRYASRRRDAHPIRVNQLFTLDERVATAVDPLFQLPMYDRDHLLQEASRALDAGRLPRYIPDEQQLKMLAEAKAQITATQALQQAQQGGGAAPARAKPKSPPGGNGTAKVDQRPATGGSPGGSASNARSSDSARRSRRGGRRGRAAGPTTMGNEMSTAADTGR